MKSPQFSLYESLYGITEQTTTQNDDSMVDDPSAEAADYAMSEAERESEELYGEVDIDRLAKEKYGLTDDPEQQISAGERYIMRLTTAAGER